MTGGDKMSINDLQLPEKSLYPKRSQISCPITPELYDRFQSFSKKFGHGSKRILIEKALVNLLDELEKK